MGHTRISRIFMGLIASSEKSAGSFRIYLRHQTKRGAAGCTATLGPIEVWFFAVAAAFDHETRPRPAGRMKNSLAAGKHAVSLKLEFFVILPSLPLIKRPVYHKLGHKIGRLHELVILTPPLGFHKRRLTGKLPDIAPSPDSRRNLGVMPNPPFSDGNELDPGRE